MTKVVVGFVHPATHVVPQFRRCLTMVLMRDSATSRHVVAELDHESSANISSARCKIVSEFLAHPGAPEWLWMVDSDMSFGEDILDRLLASADPTERPIVGGLCFSVRPVKDAAGVERLNEVLAAPLELFPTIYTLGEDGGMRQWWSYPPETVIPVDSTGAACILIHRSVLADPRWTEDGHPQPWFRESVLNGSVCSEDHFFCLRAGSFGYPVHLDTGARTGHVKTFVADEDAYLLQRARLPVPPATERVTVIVPVLGRPQNAEPFLRSLYASTGLASVLVVCSEQADYDAWTAAARDFDGVLLVDETTFAAKVNLAMGKVDTPWIFICGDDVRFHPGWLDHAEYVAARTGAHVVGTNDLGNPRIMRGEVSTHFLIRRSYIEEQGASWDGPGVVCHEGYIHNFVDNEIQAVARQRGVWAMATGSWVEHLHPHYGKAGMDATYELGRKRFATDRRHLESRIARYAVRD